MSTSHCGACNDNHAAGLDEPVLPSEEYSWQR